MGWRPSSWWARSWDRQPPADVPAEANGPAPGPAPVPVHDAWRDLPALTLTTAAPVQRVAITEAFGTSLATHNDPRFLRPLTHQVDPTIGGLVDGLALPGKPHSYDDGPDLAVLPRPVRSPAPRVQRQVAWSGSSDLATVRWEAPTPAAAAEWSAVPEDPAPMTVPDVDVPAMQRAEAGSVTGGTVIGSTVIGSTAAGGTAATAAVVTVDPPRRSRPELPIVLQRSLPATTEPPPLDEPSTMTSASSAAPTPPAAAEPVEAPLTGSAVAAIHDHARSVVGATPDADTPRSVIAGAISAPADRPLDQPTATTQPLQRSDASSTVRSRPVISETPAAALPTRPSSPSSLPSLPSGSLPSGSFPTVSFPTVSSPTVSSPTEPFPTESPSTPSLPTESPSTPSFSTPFVPTPPAASSQSAVVGLRSVLIGAPIHQRVQRIATDTEPPPEQVRPGPDQPGPDRPWPARARPDRPEPDQPLVGSSPVAAAGIASPGRSSRATEVPAPAATPIVAAGQPGHDPRASGQIPAVQRQVGSPTVATPAARASTAGAVPPAGRGLPSASDPASAPPATPAPLATSLAVGIPFVQRSSPGPVETVSTADTRHTTRVPGTGMSFTSMFAAPTAATDAIRPSFEDASPPSSSLMTVPSLQRDTDVVTPAVDTSSDISASAPSTDAGRETQPGPSVPAGGAGSVAPAPAAAPADLDEMARRLYEPLVARLRSELWLDRERAGVFGSG